MDNENVSKCFEYIGDQIKAYVVNRLANAPCTTAQLVGTFSMIVDHLSISESSLVNVLDALYREKVIDFTMVNDKTRLYSLKNFDKDYIFELNIEKVEGMIAEYKLPFFSDHRKNVEEPLYFEARKNRTCIYINKPLIVNEVIIDVSNDISENPIEETPSDNENFDVENTVVTPSEVDNSIPAIENIDDNSTESEENPFLNEDVDEDISTLPNDLENDYSANESIVENSKNELENSVEDNVLTQENETVQEDSSTSIFDSPIEKNTLTNEEDSYPFDTESADIDTSLFNDDTDDSQPEIENTIVRKTNFDSIDFSSIDDTYTDSSYSTSETTSSFDDSMDLFEKRLAEAMAKAMGQSSQDVQESDNSNSEQDNTIVETATEEDIDSADEGDNSSNTQTETLDNQSNLNMLESETVQDNTAEEDSADTQKPTSQAFAEDIVFTELQDTHEPTIDPEEERERQERALRMMDEILQGASSAQSDEPTPEDEINFEEISDHFEPVSIEPIIVKQKPEQDKLITYIKEQERINNYDWHNRLQRALVDVVETPEEVEEKLEESTLKSTYSELKALMASKNYIFKAYPSHESKSFYTENYVFSNRLARNTALFTYIFMLIEILVAYFFVDRYINKGLPFYVISAVVLLIIPIFFTIKYLLFKDKRKPANFVFGLSLVTALMIYINLMVMVVLVAFFVPALQVDVNNLKSMIMTIFYPAGLFLNIPISVCIYAFLYRSKKYHLH